MATRGKGEGSVYKRASDGMWVASVELPPKDGKRRRKVVVRKTKSDVLRELAKLRKELERTGDMPTASDTVEKYLTYWLEKVAAKRVRPNVLTSYRSLANKRIIPVLGRTRLDKLTPAHIVRLHDAITSEGLSSTYALGAHRVLSKALEDALREGRVTTNVAKLTDAPRKAQAGLSALTVDEAVRVIGEAVPALQAAPYDPEPVRWATYLLTGFRKGELLGLEWDRVGDEIDLSWQLQSIASIETAPVDYEYRHLTGKLYLARPKTRAGWRVIPVVEPLKSLLAEHKARSAPNPYGLVFVNSQGRPLNPFNEAHAWAAARERFGIDRRVRVHDLRHTTVDLLYEAGVPEDLITEIVGHSTRGMSRSYKSRGNHRRLSDAMQSMSELLAGN